MSQVLHPSQIIGRFASSRYIVFTMYLDICYIYVLSKCIKKRKTAYNLGHMEYHIQLIAEDLNFECLHISNSCLHVDLGSMSHPG